MSDKAVNAEGEARYEQVFGDTFAMYSRKEMEEFIEPFRVRFERNKLDAKEIFSGKRCFDAGCGNGRGSLFMLMNGASHVTSYDFSKKNIESTEKFLKDFGFKYYALMQGSLEKIDFPDQEFDFVWCNGVIMHTEHPNACLAELSRILKTGGSAWLYIYGSGGVYWRIIQHFRELVKGVTIETCIAALKLFRYETRYIAEYIDDWYATFLRTYTHVDLAARLEAVGFEAPELLKYGMDYDTSHRINMFATEEEKLLMGEGDLRYLLTKKEHALTDDALLLEGEYGSDYRFPELITREVDGLFDKVRDLSPQSWARVAMAAHIQRELRLVLNKKERFTMSEITDLIQSLLPLLKTVEGL